MAETESQFLNCLSDIPVASAGWNQANQLYQYSKEYRLLGAALRLAEHTAYYAYQNGGESLVHRYKKRLSACDHLAAGYLVALEERFPVMKKQPNEILPNRADCREFVSTLAYVPVNKAGSVINSALNGVEHVVDRYIVPTGSEEEEAEGSDNDITDDEVDEYVDAEKSEIALVTSRLYHLRGKVSRGVRSRAFTNYQYARSQLDLQVKQMNAIFDLTQAVRNSRTWAANRAVDAKSQAVGVVGALKTKAHNLEEQGASISLGVVQQSSNQLSKLINIVSHLSVPFLPLTGQKSLQSAEDYVSTMSKKFNEAQSLTDLKDVVIDESREKLKIVHETIGNTLEYLYEKVPQDLLTGEFVLDLDELEELLGFEREHRAPQGNCRFPQMNFANGNC